MRFKFVDVIKAILVNEDKRKGKDQQTWFERYWL